MSKSRRSEEGWARANHGAARRDGHKRGAVRRDGHGCGAAQSDGHGRGAARRDGHVILALVAMSVVVGRSLQIDHDCFTRRRSWDWNSPAIVATLVDRPHSRQVARFKGSASAGRPL